MAALDCGSVSTIDPPTANAAQSIPAAPTHNRRRIDVNPESYPRRSVCRAPHDERHRCLLPIFQLGDRRRRDGPNFLGNDLGYRPRADQKIELTNVNLMPHACMPRALCADRDSSRGPLTRRGQSCRNWERLASSSLVRSACRGTERGESDATEKRPLERRWP
jgi:hypothetical protein